MAIHHLHITQFHFPAHLKLCILSENQIWAICSQDITRGFFLRHNYSQIWNMILFQRVTLSNAWSVISLVPKNSMFGSPARGTCQFELMFTNSQSIMTASNNVVCKELTRPQTTKQSVNLMGWSNWQGSLARHQTIANLYSCLSLENW